MGILLANDIKIGSTVETPILRFTEDKFTMEPIVSTMASPSFECTLTVNEVLDLSKIMEYTNHPIYYDVEIPCKIQKRTHHKKRINKKWLKRYGTIDDIVILRVYPNSTTEISAFDSYSSFNFSADNFILMLKHHVKYISIGGYNT